MTRTDASFTCEGSRCAAWLYRPDGADSLVPCVVMAHGLSLTRHDGLDQYARALCAAGFAVLVYDHRHLGDSEGEPRQHIQPSRQLQDRRAAVEFARVLDGVDPDRIVVWGYSLGGESAAVAAATDRRIAGAILAFPMVDGLARIPAEIRSNPRNLLWLQAQAVRGMRGRDDRVPVTAEPGSRAMMTLPGEARGFTTLVAPDSPWRNEMLVSPLVREAMSRPINKARHVHCPVLLQMGERDVSAPRSAILKFAGRAPLSELRRYDFDHWQPFDPANAAVVAGDQVDWILRKVLGR